MCTRKLPGGKKRPVSKADNLCRHLWAECLKMWESQPLVTLRLPRPVQGKLYLFYDKLLMPISRFRSSSINNTLNEIAQQIKLMLRSLISFCENRHIILKFRSHIDNVNRSLWPRGLRHEPSSLARTLGSRIRIPIKAWMFVCIYSVFVLLYEDRGLATSWSLF
jgi:hypothetical protein